MNDERTDRPRGAGKSSFELIDPDTLFRFLALKPRQTVLDMGCGYGMYALAMSGFVGDDGCVYAADLWEDAIDRLRGTINTLAVRNIRPILADVSRPLPLPGESMDLILMAAVLHDLRQASVCDAALAEVRRLLRRHGTFAVVEFLKEPGPPGPPLSIRLSPDEVSHLVTPFGFTETGLHEVGRHNYLMTFVPRVACCA